MYVRSPVEYMTPLSERDVVILYHAGCTNFEVSEYLHGLETASKHIVMVQ